MCFTKQKTVTATPAAPAETLEQVAPEKKTAVKANDNASSLSIGTKKYRNVSGLGSSGLISGSPTGLDLSK